MKFIKLEDVEKILGDIYESMGSSRHNWYDPLIKNDVEEWWWSDDKNNDFVEHAHWKWDEDGMDWNIGAWVCSNCGLTFPYMEVALNKNASIRKYAYSHYCGCCGAKMDEEVE